ncbi:putative small secreted protein [Prosthecobacter fusiformis]|uniref:Putative small secreted protein n=1 Tax=Prosthecobacter fusiformis TaxID=48464 RepID=A0A4R7RMF3_9BACT|nr:entericidin A/B family lipoprotein [Prosthecobacter fusiformis]TDU66561.1 putative small secreted protein [Prosthecobacter fusiformis]
MNINDTSDSLNEATREETTARKLGYFIFAFGMFVLTLSFLSSCNTTRGLGRDVQKVGNTIETQAAKVQSGN